MEKIRNFLLNLMAILAWKKKNNNKYDLRSLFGAWNGITNEGIFDKIKLQTGTKGFYEMEHSQHIKPT